MNEQKQQAEYIAYNYFNGLIDLETCHNLLVETFENIKDAFLWFVQFCDENANAVCKVKNDKKRLS